jgi:pimeloyl-ACP methyl ester carboxylesterase
MIMERHLCIPLDDGSIPALCAEPDDACDPKAAVLLLHGFNVDKSHQLKELRALANAGFTVVCPDAPGHGEREDGRLGSLEAMPPERWHEGFLELVEAQAAELPKLSAWLREQGFEQVGAVGISMGACVALTTSAHQPCFDAVASLLGTPELLPRSRARQTPRLEEMLARAPARCLEAFQNLPLLMANGGRDVDVPPDAARRFAASLRRVASRAADLLYIEYPESAHLMRPGDWEDLWRHVERFLRRHLVEAARVP